MLYPVAGTKIFIGGPEFEAPEWVEIAWTEALGTVGIQWQTQEISFFNGDQTDVEVSKVARTAAVMQIIMAADETDPGQALLWQAARSPDNYQFRLVLPSGQERLFDAGVIGLSEIFDSANNVLRLQADLQPRASSYQRSEDQ